MPVTANRAGNDMLSERFVNDIIGDQEAPDGATTTQVLA